MALIWDVDFKFMEIIYPYTLCASAHREGTKIIDCHNPALFWVFFELPNRVEKFPACPQHVFAEYFAWP